jgi:hypothetical protein
MAKDRIFTVLRWNWPETDIELAAVRKPLWIYVVGKPTHCHRAPPMLQLDLCWQRVTRATGTDYVAIFLLTKRVSALDQVVRNNSVNRGFDIEFFPHQFFEIVHCIGRSLFIKIEGETADLPLFPFSPLQVEDRYFIGAHDGTGHKDCSQKDDKTFHV